MTDAVDRFFAGDDEALGEISPAPTVVPFKGKAAEPAKPRGLEYMKAEAAKAHGFKLTAAAELEYHAPEYLVGGLIEKNTLGMLFAEPGGCKSFLALDLGLSVSAGRDFHGHEVEQGSVIYIAGEGLNGLTRRIHAWARHHDVDLEGLPFYTANRAAQFLDSTSAKAVADAVDEIAETVGTPRMIVIDTLARNFGGGDENSTMEMNNFIAALDDLRLRYPDSVILIVHHTGHADKQRARGAMALKAALDFEFRLDKSGAGVTLVATKTKEGEMPEDMHFTLHDVKLGVDDRGEPFGSAVLVDGEAPEKSKSGKPLSGAKKLALDTYRAAAMKYGTLTDGAFTGLHLEHWREVFYQKHTGETSEAKRKAFDRARKHDDLFDVNSDLYLLKGHAGVELFENMFERDTRTDADK